MGEGDEVFVVTDALELLLVTLLPFISGFTWETDMLRILPLIAELEEEEDIVLC